MTSPSASTAATPPLPEGCTDVVDVVSDVVCPWCYIGKRHLDALINSLPASDQVLVRWHPYQLNPIMPPEGEDRQEYLEEKFGSRERAAKIYERVSAAGREAGLELAFDRITRMPNTALAHRLLSWAQESQGPSGVSSHTLAEALFSAYFTQGRNVGDREVLLELVGQAGGNPADAQSWLEHDGGMDTLKEWARKARAFGINGVPFFIFNQKLAVSGAQPVAVLKDVLTQSREARESAAARSA
jgi:predicted DsbA family dithiol-disulfide isomerase